MISAVASMFNSSPRTYNSSAHTINSPTPNPCFYPSWRECKDDCYLGNCPQCANGKYKCVNAKPSPTPNAKPVIINGFIYYGQLVPPWSNLYVKGGCNVGYIGCGLTVTASVLASYSDPTINPENLLEGDYSDLTCDGVAASYSNNVLNNNGVQTQQIFASTASNMKYQVLQAVKSGKPVLIGVLITEPGGKQVNHQTLAVKVDGNGNLIFNDPKYGGNKPLEALGYKLGWQNALSYIVTEQK